MALFDELDLTEVSLQTQRLTLRPWQLADADSIAAILGSGPLPAYLSLPDPYTLESARAFVTVTARIERMDGTGLTCAVVDRESTQIVGSASLRLPYRMRHCDIGYWIAPAAQGRGLAVEATDALTRWAHGHGVHRVELHVDVRNVASAAVALSSGFTFEGVQREVLTDADGRHDMAVFVRMANDPERPSPHAFAPFPAPGLSDGVITVRPTLLADAAALHEQEHDPVSVGFGFGGDGPTPAGMQRTIERTALDLLLATRVGPSGFALNFTIADAASDAAAGSIQLRTMGPPQIASIGYTVHPAWRGRGFTTRALRLLSRWAFDGLGIYRLELGAKSANLASQRAALTAGFRAEGTWPGRLRNPDGTFSDEASFSLLKDASSA